MARDPHPKTPHFLRFARALALGTGVGAAAAGCYMAHEVEPRADAGRPRDAPVLADASTPGDTGVDAPIALDTGLDARVHTCETCSCSWSGIDGGETCETVGLWDCCISVGPLAPPDLAA